jgi:hypothetical protein
MNAEPRIVPPPTVSSEPPAINGESSPGASLQTKPAKVIGWQIWLLRVRAILFVTVCATFGVLLVILPWTPRWTDNPLLLRSPDLRQFVSSGFVRGLASGFGILDLWLGFWEAIHYHEIPRSGDE